MLSPPTLKQPCLFAPHTRLTPTQLTEIAESGNLRLTKETEHQVTAARKSLLSHIERGTWIYGVSSGFGPLAAHGIDPARGEQHQQHLLYHLATGVGPVLSPKQARAVWALRIFQLSRGYAGISLESLQQIILLYNSGLQPEIPSLGSVGASGDLTPLAHLALEISEGSPRLQGQSPVIWQEKEALAFVNGTACMTGLAACNQTDADQALEISLIHSLMFGECLGAFSEAWNPLLASVRPHAGQVYVSEKLARWGQQSQWLSHDREHAFEPPFTERWPQDPYSLRCVPQLLGAVYDQLRYHEAVVTTELNSASDNPTIFPAEDKILHGGNFNGQHISFVSDSLVQAMVYLGVYAERRIARLTDANQNHGLPPFMATSPVGINSGLMGAQVTASALTARLRSLATPLAIQSIPTNGNNQDVVSMGTLAAWRGHEVMQILYEILAIEAMAVKEAMRIRQEQAPAKAFSSVAQLWATKVQACMPALTQDRPLFSEIQHLAGVLSTWKLPH